MKKSIENKVAGIIDSKFEIENCNYVPSLDDKSLIFGNKGLNFEATTLYIDMRGSTKILNKHNRRTVAKLHMAYFHTIVKIAKSLGGEVRSFNGDGMLVFFYGTTKSPLNNAVNAALQMKYMLTQSSVSKKLKKYSEVNFGVGIHDGEIICTKVGIAGGDNRDLVWIGNAVNMAVKIGDQCESPNHIGISERVYDNLLDDTKYVVKKNIFGFDEKINIWTSDYINYNDEYKKFYFTDYWLTVS